MSQARDDWYSVRSARIDQLISAHDMVRMPGRGRQWRTEQINWALIVRVAVEFQGFSRELHDEAIDALVGSVSGPVADVLRTSLTRNRELDRGNAQPGSLGSDFGRLGMSFWSEIQLANPRRTEQWNVKLELMNKARNGIVHHDVVKLREVADAGWPVGQLRTANRFRSAMNQLVDGMDTVVGSHVQSLIGGSRPW